MKQEGRTSVGRYERAELSYYELMLTGEEDGGRV